MVSLKYVFSNSSLEVGFCEGVKVDKLIQDLKVEHCTVIKLKKKETLGSPAFCQLLFWYYTLWLKSKQFVIDSTERCHTTNMFRDEQTNIIYIYIWMYEWGSCIKSPRRRNGNILSQTFLSNPLFQGFWCCSNDLSDCFHCWFARCFVDITRFWMRPETQSMLQIW